MRRLLYIGAAVAIVALIAIVATNDESGDAYTVRAIFDNASALVEGEDVKVAGATVGVIADMNVTGDKRAAVTLEIKDEAFTPFKRDARCEVRLQGLIGERFVECAPGSA